MTGVEAPNGTLAHIGLKATGMVRIVGKKTAYATNAAAKRNTQTQLQCAATAGYNRCSILLSAV